MYIRSRHFTRALCNVSHPAMRASIASALWAISAAVVVLAKPEPFWIGIYTCDSDTDYSVGDDCDPERGEAPQCLQPAAYREKLSKPEGNTPCPNDNLFPIAYVTLDADQQQAVTIHKQSTDEDMHVSTS